MLLTPFDPWKSSLCTCPPKLTLNPYTGCDHRCIYCYASSYIPKFGNCRPKKKLIQKLKKEASKLKGEIISDDFSISNVAKNLRLKISPVMTGGIKDVGKWVHYCPGCRSNHKNGKECPMCGTPLKRKLLKGQTPTVSTNE